MAPISQRATSGHAMTSLDYLIQTIIFSIWILFEPFLVIEMMMNDFLEDYFNLEEKYDTLWNRPE